jgi:hypothetical protein
MKTQKPAKAIPTANIIPPTNKIRSILVPPHHRAHLFDYDSLDAAAAPVTSASSAAKFQKIAGRNLNTIAGFRSLQIAAPHLAAALQASFWPDRQSYQNVSRETFWYDWD